MKASNASLTKRERQLLRLLAKALSNKEIAANMGISPSTVKRHMENILKKLNLKSRVAAAVHAARYQTDTADDARSSSAAKKEKR